MSAFLEFDWPTRAQYAIRLVTRHSLDLEGLVVLTEAATGPYSAGPSIAATARAAAIHCVLKSSEHGSSVDAEAQVREHFRALGLDENSLYFYTDVRHAPIETVNIVTNSGNLRPIDATLIDRLSRGRAVISLMWEPWELREGEIDLVAASHRGIPVVGTNEHRAPNDLRGFTRMWALKLLELHGEPIVGSRIAVVGDQPLIAESISDFLVHLGADVRRIRRGDSEREIRHALDAVDYVLVSEHVSTEVLVGAGGLIETSWLFGEDQEPPPLVGVLCGKVDIDGLRRHGASVFPDEPSLPGFLTFPPWRIGYPLPMALYASGLKVGEVAARRLLQGGSAASAIAAAIKSGYGLAVGG